MSSKRDLEKKILDKIVGGFVDFIVSRKVEPNFLTFLAFIFSLTSSLFFYISRYFDIALCFASMLLLISGFIDAIDGIVARKSNRESTLGAFLDSTLDKIGESSVFIGIIMSGRTSYFWTSLALATSILISYVRARAEALGVDLRGVGFMERAERIILIVVGGFLEFVFKGLLDWVMIALAILSLVTIVQRIIYVTSKLNRKLS
ncbi:MAG: CDP-alcohol phosphatidyltransferase family protein [Nitrososphaerota archaeon]